VGVLENPVPRGQSIKWRRVQLGCFFQTQSPDWEISSIQGLEMGRRVIMDHSSPSPLWPLVCYQSALGDNFLSDYRFIFFDVNFGVAFRARHQFVVLDCFLVYSECEPALPTVEDFEFHRLFSLFLLIA
jgi:hypothetical protein